MLCGIAMRIKEEADEVEICEHIDCGGIQHGFGDEISRDFKNCVSLGCTMMFYDAELTKAFIIAPSLVDVN